VIISTREISQIWLQEKKGKLKSGQNSPPNALMALLENFVDCWSQMRVLCAVFVFFQFSHIKILAKFNPKKYI
jgi:hypothetical protein